MKEGYRAFMSIFQPEGLLFYIFVVGGLALCIFLVFFLAIGATHGY